LDQTPLELACKNQDIALLEQLLQYDGNEGEKPIHVAVQYGDVDFMKKLPSQNVNAVACSGRTPLHYLATKYFHRFDKITNIVQYCAKDKALDVKALDSFNCSTFYIAIRYCNTNVVIALLDSFKEQIRLNEVCDEDSGPPI